jgi:hypothetical protein
MAAASQAVKGSPRTKCRRVKRVGQPPKGVAGNHNLIVSTDMQKPFNAATQIHLVLDAALWTFATSRNSIPQATFPARFFAPFAMTSETTHFSHMRQPFQRGAQENAQLEREPKSQLPMTTTLTPIAARKNPKLERSIPIATSRLNLQLPPSAFRAYGSYASANGLRPVGMYLHMTMPRR